MKTFELYLQLKLGKLHYSHTDKLLKTLQRKKMRAGNSKRLVMLAIETISSIRNEDDFNAM